MSWIWLMCQALAGPHPVEVTVVNGDAELAVRRAGHGSTVLIAIPGGPGASGSYLQVLERVVGPDRAVVTYDPRGVGRSSALADAEYGIDAWVSDVEAIRAWSGAESVHVLGHSWGGVVAMGYAATYPHRVSSLTLVSSAPAHRGGWRDSGFAVQARLNELFPDGAPPAPPGLPAACASWWPTIVAYYADPAQMSVSHLPAVCSEEVLTATHRASQDYDLRPGLVAVRAPVLLVYGDPDPVAVVLPELLRSFRPSVVEVVRTPACGHRPMFECPAEFFPLLEAQLTGGQVHRGTP